MIEVYENIIPNNLCQTLIDKFESTHAWTPEYKNGFLKDDGTVIPVFDYTLINAWEETDFIIDKFNEVGNDFMEKHDRFGVIKNIPRIFEEFRIKRYMPNVNWFPIHADAVGIRSATRFVSFLAYLNDVEEGGETTFHLPDGEFTIKPKCGSILVFPPLWCFPHEGRVVTKGKKYILSSYYRYAH